MILADTSAWIDFFNDSGSAVAQRLEAEMKAGRMIVGDLVMVEVLQGVRSENQRQGIARIRLVSSSKRSAAMPSRSPPPTTIARCAA